MKVLALDVESVPLLSSMQLPYPADERKVPASYKKPEAIAEWIKQDEIDWQTERIKQYSITPRLGRLCAIGYTRGEGDSWADVAVEESDERTLLAKFWRNVKDADLLVTFNGGFDLRWILIRSIAHGLEPSVSTRTVQNWFRRYVYSPHFDVMQALTNWYAQKGDSLDNWSQFFGLPGKVSHGSEVYGMAQAGEWGKIAQYATDDAEKAYGMYLKLKPFFLD